jgi:2-polyprenyl-3-methyl-5-hydroxy-6-metoxy-1,4-benzoquinol methylase
MGRDWHAYWNASDQVRDPDPFRQVGKTVSGVAVSPQVPALIAANLRERLTIRESDRLLELCCGNGIVTAELSPLCQSIVAVDFSEVLIATARRSFARANISYMCADVTGLDTSVLRRRFDKVFMQEALQHFSYDETDRLLASLAASINADAPIYLGSVPDAARLRSFYDTPQRYARYLELAATDSEPIGTWWEKTALETVARKHGYRTTFFAQNPEWHTAHYRFDVLCERA